MFLSPSSQKCIMAWKSQQFETPQERLKRMILERLDESMKADAQQHKKGFCINVKHFLRLMKPHISTEIVDAIEGKYDGLKEKLKGIRDNKNQAKADMEAKITEAEYDFYDEALVYGMDALQQSKIILKETEGIILAGKTVKDTQKLGAKIRKSKAVETIIEPNESGDEVGE